MAILNELLLAILASAIKAWAQQFAPGFPESGNSSYDGAFGSGPRSDFPGINTGPGYFFSSTAASELGTAATVDAGSLPGPFAGGGTGSSVGFGPGSDPGSGSGSGTGSSGFGPNFGNFPGGFNFDVAEATRTRAIHGILGAIAMVALFPSGSILMRILHGRLALWMHALTQLMGLAILLACVGLGIHLVQEVQAIGLDLFKEPSINYHPIIGLVVAACLLLQPPLGLIHHAKFKKLQRRQIWSHLHMFNGRLAITLGIVNGALGLWIAHASSKVKTAYVAAAAVMWAIWMLTALWSEWRRWRTAAQAEQRRKSAGAVSF
ncbi:956d8e0d-6cc6-48b4-a4b8-530511292064 [Thermothielavioides terrestris]|uniref:956d8e0d-6cc6-48b4-a4b8-530511292064 n=1 Tax=Thermothielavioides terrestris TaxID=2587410 RepID=A0A446BW32_9PEZI|nr:956d8e0d-6cc6-48b4-a4b8-530511292064 [Thermothielavioides terrestris]